SLVLVAKEPIIAVVVLVVMGRMLLRLRAPLVLRFDEQSITYGWQILGRGLKNTPWTAVKSYTFKEVSLIVRDGRTANYLTQIPQTALALQLTSGQTVLLGVKDVESAKVALAQI
ncbi:MAG: Unknown protein, partial [uncultured Aureispira sp.]